MFYKAQKKIKAKSLYQNTFTEEKIALFFGNEHTGLSQYTVNHCDHHIAIPQRGIVPCLNLSVSVGIFIIEITLQRQESNQSFELTESKQALLCNHFLSKAIRSKK